MMRFSEQSLPRRIAMLVVYAAVMVGIYFAVKYFVYEFVPWQLAGVIGIAVIAYDLGWRNGEASARKQAVAHRGGEAGEQEPGGW